LSITAPRSKLICRKKIAGTEKGISKNVFALENESQRFKKPYRSQLI
jgi:hypothetical protein